LVPAFNSQSCPPANSTFRNAAIDGGKALLRVKRCGTSEARRRSLSAVDPIATAILQRRE
jgi:hypothetical protein